MFLIVLHHAACHGVFGEDMVNWLLPVLCTAMIFWHVDCFIAISGWYGIRFSLRKFFNLFGVIAFWSIAKFVYLLVEDAGIPGYSSFWSGGWFGGTYLAFMFIAPVMNVALEKLMTMKQREVFFVWGVFNLGALLNWAPYNFLTGVAASGGGDISMLTFIIVYFNIRILRMTRLHERFSKRTILWMLVVFASGYIIFTLPSAIWLYCHNGGLAHLGWIHFSSYNAPHVIIMAIAVLLLFKNHVKVSGYAARAVAKLSPLMFGVYILHEGTGLGRNFYIIPQKWLQSNTAICPFVNVLSSAIIAFILCAIFDAGRRMAILPFKKRFEQKIGIIDEMISPSRQSMRERER